MTHRIVVALLLFAAPWGMAAGQPVFRDGFEESCLLDSDSDRLIDCEEASLGLFPRDPDTDDDGLADGDELLGTVDGLDLPALGVDPRHKDILIEHDWQDDDVEPAKCALHSHKPDASTLNALTAAFAAMPVPNPDGTSGIHLINDAGQGGVFDGGSHIDVANATIIETPSKPDFQAYKTQHFAANRLGYFHYAIHTHQFSTNLSSTGVAEVNGDDLLITLHCNPAQPRIRNTIMHELGHNLGLLHGGGTSCNRKPNYNSVMNYTYQLSGIDTNCVPGGDGAMNYSLGVRAPLDEKHLDETVGLCAGVGFDWNPQDGGLLTDTSKNINVYSGADATSTEIQQCGGLLTVLTDFNDFAALNLKGLPGGLDGGEPDVLEEAICAPSDPLE